MREWNQMFEQNTNALEVALWETQSPFFTPDHLATVIALWRCQPYLEPTGVAKMTYVIPEVGDFFHGLLYE
ncbi:hypothetical protein H4R35_000594 [Dimargaris xerosporica]|nr:hypothetical protein H4R35_000594 [Dimargaris xerosporica]